MNVHFHWVKAWLSKQSQKCGWTNGRQAKAFVNKCFQTYCCMPHAFDFHFHKETQYFRINKTLTICYPKHEWNGHVFFLYPVGGWIDIALISPLSLSPFYCSTKIGLNASYAYKIWFSFDSQMAIGKIEDWVSEQSISFDRTKQISFFLSLWNKIYKCLSFFRPKEVEKGVISVVSSTSTENDWMLEVWMAVTVKKRL